MNPRSRRPQRATVLAACLAIPLTSRTEGTLAVISNRPLRGVDAETIRRIYTGRLIEIDGLALRRSVLGGIVRQSEEDDRACWAVRCHIGKGVPPRDLASPAAVIAHVQQTPGAIGHIEASELRSGMNVVLRR